MLQGIGRGLLHDPVAGQLDPCRQGTYGALDVQVDRHARRAQPGHELRDLLQGRLRHRARICVWVGEQTQQATHLGHTDAPGGLDRGERRAGLLRGGVERPLGTLSLDHDHAHAVSDQVVQLSGDPSPLLRHGLHRLHVPAPLGLLRALGQRHGGVRTATNPPAESPGAEQHEPRRDHLVPGSAVPEPRKVDEDHQEYARRRPDEGEGLCRVRTHGVQRDEQGEERLPQTATELELQPGRGHDGHEHDHRKPAADQERQRERRSQDRVHPRATHQSCWRRDPELEHRREGESQHDSDVDEHLQPVTRHGSTVVTVVLPHIHIARDPHGSRSVVRGSQRPVPVLTTWGGHHP